MVPVHEYITQHVVHSGHVPLATAATVDVPLDHFNLRDTRTWAMREEDYWRINTNIAPMYRVG